MDSRLRRAASRACLSCRVTHQRDIAVVLGNGRRHLRNVAAVQQRTPCLRQLRANVLKTNINATSEQAADARRAGYLLFRSFRWATRRIKHRRRWASSRAEWHSVDDDWRKLAERCVLCGIS